MRVTDEGTSSSAPREGRKEGREGGRKGGKGGREERKGRREIDSCTLINIACNCHAH